MKLNLIRWIDKNIGMFLCFLLTVHRWFFHLIQKETPSYQKPRKILFIKLIEQGSTVLAYPALKKGADLVGKDNIYFMVLQENRFILDLLDIVPPANIAELNARNPFVFILTVLKALRWVRKEKIDAVIDMEGFARGSAILAYLCGGDKRVGLHIFDSEGPYRGNLFTHRLLHNPYVHMKYFFAGQVEALTYEPPAGNVPLVFAAPDISDSHLPRFSPSADQKNKVIEKIEQLENRSLTKPVIVLNPNASDILPIRRWPKENFIALGKKLLESTPEVTLIITGGPEEKESADQVASEISNAVSLGGQTSLEELLTVYCIADVLVTSDSGPGHFSALTPVNSIVIFGPETPKLYGVLEDNVANIVPDYICSPCVNVYNQRKSPCLTAPCLKSITVDAVYDEITKLLSKATK